MEETPLVTAIIATYNRGYIVCEAIESILSQTYPNIELIVVDDGSTDDTEHKLRAYRGRLRAVHQTNSGPAKAWNTGISNSKGSIITFLGSDDVWLPTFVQRQVETLKRAGPSVPCCISNAEARFADGRTTSSFAIAGLQPLANEGLWTNVLDILMTRFVMCGQMIAIRSEVLRRIGGFDDSLRYLEDYDIALKLSLEGPWAFIDERLVVFRQSTTGDSLSLSISAADARLHQYMLTIRLRIKRQMESHKPAITSPFVNGAVSKAKRDLWLAGFASERSFLKQLFVRAYNTVEHYRLALYHRSPRYPRMKSMSFESREVLLGAQFREVV